jgi:type IV pilus assembly protein PilV
MSTGKPTELRIHRHASGFTLIEVLVSILVFSFGVLGAVGMQARILQTSTQNVDRSRASMLANEIVAQMWGQQSVQPGASVISAWQSRVSDVTVSGLPSSTGSVAYSTVDGVTTATIAIKWRPPSMASTAAPNQYVTTMVIP